MSCVIIPNLTWTELEVETFMSVTREMGSVFSSLIKPNKPKKFFFLLLEEINIFIQQECIKLIKSGSEDIYATKDLFFK